jgi:hypothetical protein
MKKGFAIVGALMMIGLAVFIGLNGPQRASDADLISQALDEALQGAKEGKPGPVLDFISGQATLDGQGGASNAQIAEFIRKNKPEVNIPQRTPKIRGDEAAIVSPVTVNVQVLTFKQDLKIENVVIRLKRESATKWGVFPTSRWRIASVETGSPQALELFGS